MSSSTLVWFITGCTSGFGTSLALIALAAGHRVIATARNPNKDPALHKQIQDAGGVWLTLDMTTPKAEMKEVVDKALAVYGRVDVLVNNAGFSILGATEVFSDEEIKLQFETNYFGPVRLMQLLIPSMRSLGSGTIVNITSVGGVDARATSGQYGGSKFALEGVSEALAQELAPFNIRVLIVEPGAFRTNFLHGFMTPKAPLPEAYKGTSVDQALQKFVEMNGQQMGNTEEGCKRIFECVTGTGMFQGRKQYLRLPLGSDTEARVRAKIESLRETLDELEDVWKSTAY